ncbi:peptidoglycan DD-metalloendopeptidase family protein [Hyphobacterium sp. HN65]|uniref:Peptidoglycan DD-metalloendopeptidase family protein n=1 Tax=Hyphobacterium lacteum TaxID=3116575 RepID=A0ABU7LUZ1_9PROT|nr:peptidoglycan DD-metalloendopeptidase family protein [Hyphobacterium sp. HN65]MEE2527144.1 peptidoglycan DD-metalloendopeptidase family protein [Hyphobacterium sp. HN65]
MLSVRLILLLSLASSLAACATPAPRDPAHIDYRRANASGPSRDIVSPAPRCEPGSRYIVQTGDTLSEIAEACSVSTAALGEANGLYPPYTVYAGQELTFPRPSTHTVRRGENLYRIGLRYNVSHLEIASLNGIGAPYSIEVGQVLQLPGSASSGRSSPPQTRREPRTETPTRTASVDSGVTIEETAPPPRRTTPRDAPASSGPVTFQWPIRGEILSTFGPKPDGRRNDGVNIAAEEGASVRAAAAGTVVYAGGELQGYGELILIRHDGGWVTAYAHNSRLLVGEGDRVDQGQLIAEAGSTGSVDTPQVHFEIRQGVTPVDPAGHLPGS